MTIHLVVRYRELLREMPDASERTLVREMSTFMAKPCFYTILTTAVAFASLVVSDIRPIIDFGWMMTIGLGVSYVTVFLVIPCVLMILPRATPDTGVDVTRKITMKMADLTERRGNTILVVYLVLTLISIYGLFQLKVENRFIDYFDETTEIYQGMELIDKKLGGTTPFDIILDVKAKEPVTAPVASPKVPAVESVNKPSFDDDEFGADEFAGDDFAEDEFGDDEFGDDEFGDDAFGDDEFGFDNGGFGEEEGEAPTSYWFTRQGLEEIRQLHDYVESLSVTGKVSSLASTYEMAAELSGGELNDFELIFLYKTLPDHIREAIVDPYLLQDKDQTRISIRVMESDYSLRRGELMENIRNYAINDMGLEEEQVHFTNMLVLYHNMLVSLFRSQILTLGAVFFGILVMFLVLFRSFRLSIVAIIPNVVAASWVLGTMGLMGVPLDMMTITIAAIVIGIGVDDCIHYIHRYKREFKNDEKYLDAMYRSHGSIGKAMYYTTVTIMAGFSILAFSKFTPSLYFGLLTSCAMFAALAGALLLLPKLILVMKPLGPGK
jgi:predicted RND superfamily exporter protein